TIERRRLSAEVVKADCGKGEFKNAALPDYAKLTSGVKGIYMSAKDTCGVLLKAPFEQIVYPTSSGIYWSPAGTCRYPNGGGGTVGVCPTLRITVPRLNAATPPTSISSLEQASLDQVK